MKSSQENRNFVRIKVLTFLVIISVVSVSIYWLLLPTLFDDGNIEITADVLSLKSNLSETYALVRKIALEKDKTKVEQDISVFNAQLKPDYYECVAILRNKDYSAELKSLLEEELLNGTDSLYKTVENDYFRAVKAGNKKKVEEYLVESAKKYEQQSKLIDKVLAINTAAVKKSNAYNEAKIKTAVIVTLTLAAVIILLAALVLLLVGKAKNENVLMENKAKLQKEKLIQSALATSDKVYEKTKVAALQLDESKADICAAVKEYEIIYALAEEVIKELSGTISCSVKQMDELVNCIKGKFDILEEQSKAGGLNKEAELKKNIATESAELKYLRKELDNQVLQMFFNKTGSAFEMLENSANTTKILSVSIAIEAARVSADKGTLLAIAEQARMTSMEMESNLLKLRDGFKEKASEIEDFNGKLDSLLEEQEQWINNYISDDMEYDRGAVDMGGTIVADVSADADAICSNMLSRYKIVCTHAELVKEATEKGVLAVKRLSGAMAVHKKNNSGIASTMARLNMSIDKQ